MATQPLNILIDWAETGVASSLTYKVYSIDGTERVTGTGDATEFGTSGVYGVQADWDAAWGLPMPSVWTDGVDTALGDERGSVNVVQVNNDAAAAANLKAQTDAVLMINQAAGGSTTTRVVSAEAYDSSKHYAGALLNWKGVPRLISAYSDSGSGASYLDLSSALPGVPQAGDTIVIQTNTVSTAVTSAADIAAALAGSGLTVSVGIVNGMIVEAIKGDDYSVDANRQWNFAKIAGEPWPDDLTGHTITLAATLSPDAGSAGDAAFTLTGAIDVATGDSQQVHVTPTSIQTSTWATGIGSKGYRFKLVATKDGFPKTLREGVITVRT